MTAQARHAARAILVTPARRVLLMRMDFPWVQGDVWILPGGGIEAGESAEQAVIREVYEETGGTNITIIGEAWRSERLVEATNTRLLQRYFWVNTEEFAAAAVDLSEQEMDWVREYRWWSVHDIAELQPAVDPPTLAHELQLLLDHGLPSTPVEVSAPG